MALTERMQLAEGKPLKWQLMAAMGQLDCGQCGYQCDAYAAEIASGAEKDLTKCVPGGKATSKTIKLLLEKNPVLRIHQDKLKRQSGLSQAKMPWKAAPVLEFHETIQRWRSCLPPPHSMPARPTSR